MFDFLASLYQKAATCLPERWFVVDERGSIIGVQSFTVEQRQELALQIMHEYGFDLDLSTGLGIVRPFINERDQIIDMRLAWYYMEHLQDFRPFVPPEHWWDTNPDRLEDVQAIMDWEYTLNGRSYNLFRYISNLLPSMFTTSSAFLHSDEFSPEMNTLVQDMLDLAPI